MQEIELIDGVKITDMFLGISSDREEGQTGRYELNALPKEQLSALGTKMFVVLEFGEQQHPDGVILNFRYDNYDDTEMVGVDKMPVGKKTFDILPPYKSPKIRKVGNHTLYIEVIEKNFDEDGELIVDNVVSTFEVPYRIV